MTSAVRSHSFRLLWAGETASQFAFTASQTTVPLLAVTLLAATPFQMGLLTAAGSAAFLLIGLPAGAWLDRMNVLRAVVVANVCRAVLLASVPLALVFDVLSLAHLVIVALLAGAASVFFDLGYQSAVPLLLGREALVDGNGKLEASRATAQATGPALGGALVQVAGGVGAVGASALAYLVSTVALRRIGRGSGGRRVAGAAERQAGGGRAEQPFDERSAERQAGEVSLRAQIAEGMRFVLRHPALRAVTFCSATLILSSSLAGAVVLLFLTRELHLSPAGAGAVLAVGGVAGVLGALTSGRVGRVVGTARLTWVVAVVTWPFGFLLPLADGPVLFAVGWALLGYGGVVYNVGQVSLRQSLCPKALLSRMNASVRFLTWGAMPAGGVLGGVLGQWLGLTAALAVAAAGMVLAPLWLIFSPVVGLRDIPEES
ncbi:MFS transporter [Lentzea sp. NPDC054927]